MDHLCKFKMTAMEPNSNEGIINTQRHNSISYLHLHSSRKEPGKALIPLRRARIREGITGEEKADWEKKLMLVHTDRGVEVSGFGQKTYKKYDVLKIFLSLVNIKMQ